MHRVLKNAILAVGLAYTLIVSGCASYYTRQAKFNRLFESGDLEGARTYLENHPKMGEGKNRLLYFCNLGTVSSITGKYYQSNMAFEEAWKTSEDYQLNPAKTALSYLTNPEATEYIGEDHEIILMNYYKALNYLKLGRPDEALVEAKRIYNRLNRLKDKYSRDSVYKNDAFAHTVMGWVYEANLDYNNAFIAYRNALNCYNTTFKRLFNQSPPRDLVVDVIRMAYKTGFDDLAQDFERKYNLQIPKPSGKTGQLVFLWNNGLGPIKTEFSINLNSVKGEGGQISFVNPDFGLNIPYIEDPSNINGNSNIQDLRMLRLALPQYTERPMVQLDGTLFIDSVPNPMQFAYDLNGVARQVLKQRMLKEISSAVARVAVKQAAVVGLEQSKKTEGAAVLLSVLNAATEKADTRNWQTLPHSIYYRKITLPVGQHTLVFKSKAKAGFVGQNQIYKVTITENGTSYISHTNLDYDQRSTSRIY